MSSVKRCLFYACFAVGLQLIQADEYTVEFFLKQIIVFVITQIILSAFLTLYEVVKIKIEKKKI